MKRENRSRLQDLSVDYRDDKELVEDLGKNRVSVRQGEEEVEVEARHWLRIEKRHRKTVAKVRCELEDEGEVDSER